MTSVLPSKRERERHAKACEAMQHFYRNDHLAALSLLKDISATTDADDVDSARVQHNMAVARFYMSTSRSPSALLDTLSEIGSVSASLALGGVDGLGSAVLKYNKAVLLTQEHQYTRAVAILEDLYDHLQPLDEQLSFRVCLLLIDAYIATNRPGKAEKVIDYLTTPGRFDKLLSASRSPHSPLSPHDPASHRSRAGKKHSEKASGDTQAAVRCFAAAHPTDSLPSVELGFLMHLYRTRVHLLSLNLKAAKKSIKIALQVYQRELKHEAQLMLQSATRAAHRLHQHTNGRQGALLLTDHGHTHVSPTRGGSQAGSKGASPLHGSGTLTPSPSKDEVSPSGSGSGGNSGKRVGQRPRSASDVSSSTTASSRSSVSVLHSAQSSSSPISTDVDMALDPSHSIAALFLKAQMEFLRGNLDKSIKLMNTVRTTAANHGTGGDTAHGYGHSALHSTFHVMDVTEASSPVLYFHNMGVLHMRLSKFAVASQYFAQALRCHDASGTEEKSKLPDAGRLYKERKLDILYNVGLCFFMLQEYECALDAWRHVLDSGYRERANLWLRVGQCGVSLHRRRAAKDVSGCQRAHSLRYLQHMASAQGSTHPIDSPQHEPHVHDAGVSSARMLGPAVHSGLVRSTLPIAAATTGASGVCVTLGAQAHSRSGQVPWPVGMSHPTASPSSPSSSSPAPDLSLNTLNVSSGDVGSLSTEQMASLRFAARCFRNVVYLLSQEHHDDKLRAAAQLSVAPKRVAVRRSHTGFRNGNDRSTADAGLSNSSSDVKTIEHSNKVRADSKQLAPHHAPNGNSGSTTKKGSGGDGRRGGRGDSTDAMNGGSVGGKTAQGGGGHKTTTEEFTLSPSQQRMKELALLNLVYLGLELGTHAVALEDANALLKCMPLPPNYLLLTRNYMAEALCAMNRFEEAVACLNPAQFAAEAFESQTKGAPLRYGSSTATVQGTSTTSSTSHASATATKCALYTNLGVAYALRGQTQPAWQCVQRALRMLPAYKPAVCLRLYLLLRQGNTGEAMHMMQAQRVDPLTAASTSQTS